jgi:AcrR family transcriptional regulator
MLFPPDVKDLAAPMKLEKPNKRVSKAEWLAMAFFVFREEGEPGVKIVDLARKLDVNKSGFYWHFKDRDDLLDQMFDLWAHEFTEVVTKNPVLQTMPPKERLRSTMQMIFDHKLAELDVHFNAWALKDPAIKQRLKKVMSLRLKYLKQLFSEAGCDEKESEMRAKLFVGYESNELLMFSYRSKAQAMENIGRRWNLYLSGL